MYRRSIRPTISSLFFSLFVFANCVSAEIYNIEPPVERAFIVDKADLIDAATEDQIRAIADSLLTETVLPIIVVTIDSMAEHGGQNMSIETFASMLFDQWGIGHPEVNNTSWNRGILLVVSKYDRRARIELGADWAHEYDSACQRIMDEQIIPNFKQENFSGGILAAVIGLDRMARGLELPPPVRPKWFIPAVIALIGLGIFTIVSLIRRGSSGWAWLFWGVVFSAIAMILIGMLRNSSSSGFGGGSFGGGFSGGGGASGSW